MEVIVNADDLGHSETVNRAVFDLMAMGRITSSTLLANGPAFDDAVSRSRDYPQCSFGVHLNISEFQPVTRDPELRPILDSRGWFAGNIREIAVGNKLRAAIYEEWSAQIGRMVAVGITPSHIDSHHHVHTIAAMFPVLKRLQRRFNLRKVRISTNIYPTDAPARRSLLVQKCIWNYALRRCYRTVTSDGFSGLSAFLSAMKHAKARYRSVELMVHPGNPIYEQDVRLLSQCWWNALPFGVKVVNYYDLSR